MKSLIGRASDLQVLRAALESARKSSGSCQLLTGEAGIGKSRLVEELKAQAVAQGMEVLQGNCYEEDASVPYAPWIDALRLSFASQPAGEIRSRLGPFASELVKLLPELRLIIPEVKPNPPLNATAEKHRAFESISRYLILGRASVPSLFILEDLHWSDSLSLELLHFLARRISPLPIAIVGTYRSEEPTPHLARLLSDLNRENLLHERALQRMNAAEVGQMIRAAVKTDRQVPAGVVNAILATTDGNPLFVEEVLKSLEEEGHLDRLLQPISPDEIQVPRSIRWMVQERVARLPEPAQAILLQASVIGERFDIGILREISGRSEQELLPSLKELLKSHLVRQESASQFSFTHAITRDAVRSMLMLVEQKALHEKIGLVLEQSSGAEAHGRAGELAYHFYHAQVWTKALEYGQQAGETALALYAPGEAITFFTQAITAAHRLGMEASVTALRKRAHAFELSGDFDSALEDYQEALQSAVRAGDRSAECECQVDLGLVWQARDWKQAGEWFRRALELARELGEPQLLARTLNRVGNWHLNQGRPQDAVRFHTDALQLFQSLNDPRGTAQTLDLLGLANYGLGELIAGAAYLEQAIPIFRELDDRQGLVNTLSNLTVRARLDTQVLGDIDFLQLTALSDEAHQIAHGFAWSQGEALALMQGAISLQQAGEYAQALRRISEARSIVDEGQDREEFARLHLITGGICADLLDFSEARRNIEAALAVLRDLGSGLLVLGATAQLASVAVHQGDLPGARVLLDGLLPAGLPQGQVHPGQRGAWCARAELELAEGQPQRALEIVEAMLGSTADAAKYGTGAVPRLARLRASALAVLERLPEAEGELLGAIGVSERQGCRPMLWRLHVDLANVYRSLRSRQQAEGEFAAAREIIEALAESTPEGALRDSLIRQTRGLLPPVHIPTSRQAAKVEFGGLTGREREIATLVARGRSNREIAGELVISEKTVERHVANILLKLGFNSRTQIAVWATEMGLHS